MAVRLLYIILGYYCARGVDFIAITDGRNCQRRVCKHKQTLISFNNIFRTNIEINLSET